MMLEAIAYALLALAQDPAPPATGSAGAGTAAGEQAPAPEPVPGEIPSGASEEAKQLWRSVVQATAGKAPAGKVEGFDLVVDSRAWQGSSSTDLNDGRIRFLAPKFVDTMLKKDGRRRVLGPRGYFLIEPDGRSIPLQGVELAEDRKELDRIVHLSRTFASLVDPRALRLRALAKLPAAPDGIAPELAERAKALQWLSLDSPDFAMADPDGKSRKREVRATLGVDPASFLPQIALVAELENGRADEDTMLLLAAKKWSDLDGFRVPNEIQTFAREPSPGGPVFTRRLFLWLKPSKSTLRPGLKAEDFVPKDRK
jgi:hypothetical protein